MRLILIQAQVQSTLLLNASYEPMKVISWQRAVTLFFLGKVEVVHEYEHDICSVSVAIKMPSVVRLLQFVHLGRRKPPLTKLNVLARDNFSCQYCAKTLTYKEATFDHVLPRSQGGGNSWTNIVTACHGCNRKKGGKTPQQAKMKLQKAPIEPDWLPVLTMRVETKMPEAWMIFLST